MVAPSLGKPRTCTGASCALIVTLAIVSQGILPRAVLAQTNRAPSNRPQDDGDTIVELNLSGSVKVTTLLDLMSKQLGIRFLHGTDIARREVTVYTPARLPKRVLPTLLGSLLREANLAIVDSEVPGWKRVIDIADMINSAPTGDADEIRQRNGPAAAVTQVMRVRYLDVTSVTTSLSKFLGGSSNKAGSNIVALPDQKILIVTGYAADVRLIAELLEVIDRPGEEGVIEFYPVRRRTPDQLIKQYESIQAANATSSKSPSGSRLLVDRTGRRVVVAGGKEAVAATLKVLEQLDSGSAYLTRVYRLENVSAQRLQNLIQGFVDNEKDQDSKAVETTIDEEGNLLVVRAGMEVHQQIEVLIRELDQPIDSEESPIRFYKLRNATAVEVLYSLRALQDAAGSGVAQAGGIAAGAFGTLGGAGVGGLLPYGAGGQTMGGNVATGTGRTSAQSQMLQDIQALGGGSFGLTGQNLGNNLSSTRVGNQNAVLGQMGGIGGGFVSPAGGFGAGAGVATLPGGARVSADVSTNSLIVYAPANVQALYEKLIRSLDQRRPQVLIEAVIVAIDTSNNFSLGVEVSSGDRQGTRRLFEFTSFGLSQVNPTTGALTVDPSLGFNGVLVDPDVADVIIQALSQHTRGRVLSSPKILVNDNQTGVLNSISSIPFQAFSQGETTTLNGLGGNQEAGTTIQVTPHINEDDHLQLEFDVEFSTFIGQGTAALPPPRQIDRVGSVVTIPDGRTVVVGGLKRSSEGDSFTGVPWLEKVPVLREISSLRASNDSTTSFFLFIRPRILRDSQFRDLKFLSDVETQDATLDGDYPVSRPLLVPCPVPPPGVTSLRPTVQRSATDFSVESYSEFDFPIDESAR